MGLDHGDADPSMLSTVSVDGVLRGYVDLYSSQNHPQRAVWEACGLSYGQHAVVVSVR